VDTIIIAYSGHAYVVLDILKDMGRKILGYMDKEEKKRNPYHLNYLGSENTQAHLLKENHYFIAIGNNKIRKKVGNALSVFSENNLAIQHSSAFISSSSKIAKGVMIAPSSTINALARIGTGVICNTACIIEHECQIGDYAHIAPGAVLAGNVNVGECSFIGANAVVRESIIIGDNVIVGAGSVVIRNIPDNVVAVGNPARIIKR
jgi:sugar O-acyltransferase (sialic acid O-acetyltransferase NeuD family)